MRLQLHFPVFHVLLTACSTLGGAIGCDTGGESELGPPSASGSSSGASAGGASAGAGVGGALISGGSGGAGAPATGSGEFVLAWEDEFTALDTARWQAQDFTFDGNQAQFTPANVSVKDGALELSLTPAPEGSTKPYLGVELRSAETLTYGKVSTRMRFAKGSGVVSSVVLFYTPYPNCDWNEIDVEHLGKAASAVQVNAMVFPGVQDPNCTTSVKPTQDPLLATLPFDAEADYHVYDIEWTPAGVDYYADGAHLRNWNKEAARLTRPLTVLLTIWASSAASWAGPISAESAPTSASVDWIKVYSWKPASG